MTSQIEVFDRLALWLTWMFGLGGVILALALVSPSFRSSLPKLGVWQTGYHAGDQLNLDPALYSSRRATVLVVGRGSCGACQAEKPRFRRIVAGVQGPETGFILLFPIEATAVDSAFAEEIGVRLESIRVVPLRSLRTVVSPTFLVVDATGRILFAREGSLADSDERIIMHLAAG